MEADDDDGTGTGCDGTVESGLASSISGALLTDGGTYIVKVNESGMNNVLNPYRLKLVVTSGLSANLFNTGAAATSFNLIAPVRSTNTVESSLNIGTQNFYGIEVRAGDSLFASLRGDANDLDLALIDTDGTTVLLQVDSDSSAPRSEGFCYSFPTTGRYFLKVFDIGGTDGGDYSLMASSFNSDGSCEILSETHGPIGTGNGFHGVLTGRLNRFSPPGYCSIPEASPGVFGGMDGERNYDEYRLTNNGLEANCISAVVDGNCGAGNFFAAVYKDSFDPTNIETNYLADPGSSTVPGRLFSFAVDPGQDFSVVVHDLNPGVTCEGYSLRLCATQCTDIAVSKTADVSEAPIGTPFTYTLRVSNNGPEDSAQVLGSDEVPAGLSIVGTTSTQGSVNVVGNNVSFNLGALALGASADVTITTIPNSEGVQVNTAVVQGSGFDIAPNSNLSSVEVATGTDGDGDGQVSGSDNCPTVANPGQEDSDGDGVGDACDNCPTVSNASQSNLDGDSAGDACEVCPTDSLKLDGGVCGCGAADSDANQNGVIDCLSTLELNALLQALQKDVKKLKGGTSKKAIKLLRKRKKVITANLNGVNSILQLSIDSVQTTSTGVNLPKLNNTMRKAVKSATKSLSATSKKQALSKVKKFQKALAL